MTDRELMQMVFKAIDAVNDFSSNSIYAGIFDLEVKLLRSRLAQPEREWQGLTDEEIKNHWLIAMQSVEGTVLPIPEFARAIEAKLKEKNNG